MGSQIEDNPGHYYKHKGALYSVEHDGSVIKRLSNISISNGLAWSMDNKEFYFVDTYKFAVVAYDFDIVSGNLCEIHFIIYYIYKIINYIVIIIM